MDLKLHPDSDFHDARFEFEFGVENLNEESGSRIEKMNGEITSRPLISLRLTYLLFSLPICQAIDQPHLH